MKTSVAEHDRVAGVVAALVADDPADLLGEEVGRLALPLVAPLEPDDHGRRHRALLACRRAPGRRGGQQERPSAPAPGTCGIDGPRRAAPRGRPGTVGVAARAHLRDRAADLGQWLDSCGAGRPDAGRPRRRGPAEYSRAAPRPAAAARPLRSGAGPRQPAARTSAAGSRYLSATRARGTPRPYAPPVIRLLGALGLLAPIGRRPPRRRSRCPAAPSRATGPTPAGDRRRASLVGVAVVAAIVTALAPGPHRAGRAGRRADRRGRRSRRRCPACAAASAAASPRPSATVAATLAETHDAATTDRLTGIANRPAILAALFSEVERAARYDRPLAVAFVDIDLFKAVNDTYGHDAGDVVLRGVAATLRANLRAADTVGRYGGEEFMVILPETDVDAAAALAEKLRQLVLGASVRDRGARRGQRHRLDRRRGRRRAHPARRGPRPRRRRGDVLGEVPRAQPGLPLRGARRGRPRPARPDLARGTRPGRRGRAARPVAPPSRRSSRRSSRYPNHRGQPSARDRHARRPPGAPPRPARRRARPAAHRGPPPRRRQAGAPRGDPGEAGGPHLAGVAGRRPAPADRPGHPRAGVGASGTPCRSCSTTTSASAGTATRTACAARRSRSGPGSWPSPTPTTR